MLLMVEKGIRGGIRYDLRRKDYDKKKESSNLKYWDVNNLYEWVMPQTFPVNGFT